MVLQSDYQIRISVTDSAGNQKRDLVLAHVAAGLGYISGLQTLASSG